MTQVLYAPGYAPPEAFMDVRDIFILDNGWVKLVGLEGKSLYMPREAFVYIEVRNP